MRKNVEVALRRAFVYLKSQQQADGNFVSFSSPDIGSFRQKFIYHTTFAPALILAALSQLDHPEAHTIRDKLADFLLQQKSEHWSFNYWARESREAKNLPYPDDLDDTFCALSALWLHDSSLIDETVLAYMVKLLLATESQVGGPYRTWLVSAKNSDEWQDVDLAVNSNIAYFLSLTSNPLPNLTIMMEAAIKKRTFQSPYYPDFYPVTYYLARAYHGPLKSELAHYLLEKRQSDGCWDTPLHTALALSSLFRLGDYDLTEAVRNLLEAQVTDGSWSAEAFCLDPIRGDRVHYGGSSMLTTAFVIEALALFQKTLKHTNKMKRSKIHPIQKQVISRVTQDLKTLDKDLRDASLTSLDQISRSKNAEEIMQLPYLFYRSLKTQPPLTKGLLIELGLANLSGWMAYTVYDDFLDDEGNPRLLSAANVALRRSVSAFLRTLPRDAEFQTYVQNTFDIMDAANTWEVTHCRFSVTKTSIIITQLPDYGELYRLAERSQGHTLTPLAVLVGLGVSVSSRQARYFESAFRHYLIARQLNDDAHDWKDDFKAGRITYVVSEILKELPTMVGKQSFTNILPVMERQFWHHTLGEVCQNITHHTTCSRRQLRQSGLLVSDNILEKLLDSLEISVQKTRETVIGAEKFLASYRSSGSE